MHISLSLIYEYISNTVYARTSFVRRISLRCSVLACYHSVAAAPVATSAAFVSHTKVSLTKMLMRCNDNFPFIANCKSITAFISWGGDTGTGTQCSVCRRRQLRRRLEHRHTILCVSPPAFPSWYSLKTNRKKATVTFDVSTNVTLDHTKWKLCLGQLFNNQDRNILSFHTRHE